MNGRLVVDLSGEVLVPVKSYAGNTESLTNWIVAFTVESQRSQSIPEISRISF